MWKFWASFSVRGMVLLWLACLFLLRICPAMKLTCSSYEIFRCSHLAWRNDVDWSQATEFWKSMLPMRIFLLMSRRRWRLYDQAMKSSLQWQGKSCNFSNLSSSDLAQYVWWTWQRNCPMGLLRIVITGKAWRNSTLTAVFFRVTLCELKFWRNFSSASHASLLTGSDIDICVYSHHLSRIWLGLV